MGTDVALRALMKSTKMDLEEVGWGEGGWTKLIWLRRGIGGGHLYMR